jgi:hypothetical protein
MRRHRALLAAQTTVAALAMTVALSPTAGAADGPDYFWRWSDGSERPTRTLDTASGGGLPALVVATLPASPGQRVRLQFRDALGWHTEDAATTGADGTARLHLNPFCEDGDWCRRTFTYRLVAGGRTAALRVTFGR